jgi:hypothetical protein
MGTVDNSRFVSGIVRFRGIVLQNADRKPDCLGDREGECGAPIDFVPRLEQDV